MSRAGLILAIAVALVACGGPAADTGPRQSFAKDHCSFRPLEGWAQGHEKGSLTFSRGKTVLAIRAVAVHGRDTVKPRTDSVMIAATQRVLEHLPQAHVGKPFSVNDAGYRATAWDLTFVPPGQRQAVHRRHVLLMGGDDYVFHVMATTRASKLDDTSASAFSTILATLREEA